jgi:hypothetical protein
MAVSIFNILDDTPGRVYGNISNLTDDRTPSAQITFYETGATVGSTVTLYNSGAGGALATLGQATLTQADLDRGYVYVTPSADLADGGYSFVVGLAIAGSTQTLSAARGFTLDQTLNLSPLITQIVDDAAPNAGATDVQHAFQQIFTNDTTPTARLSLEGLQVAAGDHVQLLGGPSAVDHIVTSDDLTRGYVDLTSGPLADGWQHFSTQITHADGSPTPAPWNQVDVRIDTQPPGAPAILGATDDAGASTGAVANGGTTDDTTPTLSISYDTEIPPPTGGSPGHNPYSPSTTVGGQIQVFANGALIDTVEATSTTPVAVQLASLAPGTYSLTSRVIDLAGNVGALSAPYALTIQTDGSSGGSGQVLTSDQYADTLTGGAGADTLNAGQGPDQLTGAGGGDVFTFKDLPWNAGHVTDFAVGTDRLDLSALFQASGYAGSNPMADGYVSLQPDGAGGTVVFYDTDGPSSGNTIQFRITDLDHVATGGLDWAQLAGGTGGSPPGQVLTSEQYADTLTGGAGADTLNAGQGPDRLTGAGGGDHFVFAALPWNAGHITDFTPGTDVLDLRPLFQQAGYSGANPLADGHLEFRSDGAGDTQVYVDPDGPNSSPEWPFLITTLDHVSPGQVGAGDFLFH